MSIARSVGFIAVSASLSLGACSQAPETQMAEGETPEPQIQEAPAAEAPQLEGAERAAAIADASLLLLDVREPSELEELGTVEGYVNIPIDQLAERLDELPRDKPILTL